MAVRGAKALEVWARRVTEGYLIILFHQNHINNGTRFFAQGGGVSANPK